MKVKVSDIKIGSRFRKDLGDIGPLADSIKRHGLLHPVVITEDKELVCGRRRLEAFTKLGLEEIEANIVSLADLSGAEADENIVRKNFTVSEIAEVDERIRDKITAEARERMVRGKKQRQPCDNLAQGQKTTDIIAKRCGISGSHLEKIRVIKQAATEHPELVKNWTQVVAGKMKVDKGYNKVKQFKKIRNAELDVLKNPNPILNGLNFRLELGPMEDLGKKIPSNSIDMIFTDPPYAAEYLYLYDELSSLALRVLKPGGSMAVILPNGGPEYEYVFDHIRKAGMIFHHYITLLHEGGTDRLHKLGIWVNHKPLLWFSKPYPDGKNNLPKKYFDLHNVVLSNAPLKNDHDWEQGTKESEYMINPLTVKGETILDPFMGSGTTGEAALKLGRKFIGIDNDEISYSTAMRRLQIWSGVIKEIYSRGLDTQSTTR